MTTPRGQPRKYPPVKCPKCGEEVGVFYLERHIKKCKDKTKPQL